MRSVILAVVASAALVTGVAIGSQDASPPQGSGRGGGRDGSPTGGETGTGVIVGTVVDAVTGRPVPGAIVTLTGRGREPSVMVGTDGRFAFRDLPPGSYVLPVSKTGYLDSSVGKTTPTGPPRPIPLREGDRVGDVVLRLWRQSILSGTVIDERGEPAVDVRVTLFQRVFVNGQWSLQDRGSTRTDDRGSYRFSRIGPGRYLIGAQQDADSFMEAAMAAMAADLPLIMNVLATAFGGGTPMPDVDFRARVIPVVFAPGVTAADEATAISVGWGDERTGLTIRAARVPTYRITGTVSGAEPMPQNLSLHLMSPAKSDLPVGMNIGNTGRGGRFDFAAVPPGEYELQAIAVPRTGGRGRESGPGAPRPPAPDAPTWWATQRITITDQDALGIALILRQGVRIAGRLQFEGNSPPPAAERFSVVVSSVDGSMGGRANTQSPAAADGSFRTLGLPPGRYALRVSGNNTAPWRLKAVRVAARDLTDFPIDVEGDDISDVVIALTDQPPAAISGVVRDTRGDGAAVFAFPVDRQLWASVGPTPRRFRTSRVGDGGGYRLTGLPEGDYFVFAGSEERLTDWLQPDVLERFASLAARIQLREGEQRTLDLTRNDR